MDTVKTALDTFVKDASSLEDQRARAQMEAIPPYQQLVILEKADIDLKTASLAEFLKTPPADAKDQKEFDRLTKQLAFMEGYQGVLEERIADFVV